MYDKTQINHQEETQWELCGLCKSEKRNMVGCFGFFFFFFFPLGGARRGNKSQFCFGLGEMERRDEGGEGKKQPFVYFGGRVRVAAERQAAGKGNQDKNG